jgi:transcriptional regulator with XRE-family HTH domain
MKSVAKTMKALRQARAWSQGDVARQLDISIPAYSKIENGLTDINLSRIEQIAAIFELTVLQLISNGQPTEGGRQVQELNETQLRLQEREAEVVELQRKVIQLFEELRQRWVNA